MKYIRLFFIILMICILSTVSVSADNTSWNKVTIKQGSVGHSSGCTVCTLQLILQNSATLKSEHQLSGAQTSSGGAYGAFDSAFEATGAASGDSWIIGNFINAANSMTNATWSSPSVGNFDSTNYTVTALTGMGNKEFKSMSLSEQITCMKTLWNGGYFIVFGVDYEGVSQDSNGPTAYRAAHVAMLAGVDDSEIYLNDPASGSVRGYSSATGRGGAYQLLYALPFKNDKSSPMDLAGGKLPVTEGDSINAEVIGIDPSMVSGYYTEDQLSAYCKLTEINIQDLYLDAATREALTQTELTGLSSWQLNVDMQEEEHGAIRLLRVLTMFIGIVLVIYSMLLYIAYWIDRTNSVIPVELLSLLTFGKLHISGSEEDSTFNLNTEGVRSVNHANIIFISLVCIGFGFLLISGIFYTIVSSFVNFVLGFLR